MPQLETRNLIDKFKYSVITQLFDQADIDNFRDWVYKGHCATIKKFTSKDNSQWITRNYLSAKNDSISDCYSYIFRVSNK